MKHVLPTGRPLLVFAHKGEAQAFVAHFKASSMRLPSLDRLSLFESQKVFILITGEGRDGACQNLSDVLESFPHPITRIINLGVAGALTPTLPLKTIVLVQKVFALERAIYQCVPIKMADKWVMSDLFTAEKRILEAKEREELAKVAPLVDREAHGLAQAAQLFNLPFFSLKVVSDLPWQIQKNANDQIYTEEVKKKAAEWSTLLLEAFKKLN